MTVDQIINIALAAATLLGAVAGFLTVVNKQGVHSAKLEVVDQKVTAIAAKANAVATEAKAAEPAIEAVVDAAKPVAPAA